MFKAMKGDLSSEKGKLYGYYCDVSDLSSIKEAFAWIEENFKVVNILVNNAGIARFALFNLLKFGFVHTTLCDLTQIEMVICLVMRITWLT